MTCTIARDGRELFSGSVSTSRLHRKIETLIEYLLRANPVPRRIGAAHRHRHHREGRRRVGAGRHGVHYRSGDRNVDQHRSRRVTGASILDRCRGPHRPRRRNGNIAANAATF